MFLWNEYDDNPQEETVNAEDVDGTEDNKDQVHTTHDVSDQLVGIDAATDKYRSKESLLVGYGRGYFAACDRQSRLLSVVQA